MTREEFIKQRCEIDKITEEEFEEQYRVVKCNCGQPYCKGYRCLDLDDLLKENEELKKHLKVPKACNLKMLEDYKSYYEDTTREQVLEDTYIEYCAYVNLAHRYSKLKKQLDKAHDELYTLKNKYNIRLLNQISENIEPDCEDYYLAEIETKAHKYDLIQNQQKEFIKYLEDEIKELQKIKETELDCDILKDVIPQLLVCKDVLQKYKEIIGNDINVGSKGENK